MPIDKYWLPRHSRWMTRRREETFWGQRYQPLSRTINTIIVCLLLCLSLPAKSAPELVGVWYPENEAISCVCGHRFHLKITASPEKNLYSVVEYCIGHRQAVPLGDIVRNKNELKFMSVGVTLKFKLSADNKSLILTGENQTGANPLILKREKTEKFESNLAAIPSNKLNLLRVSFLLGSNDPETPYLGNPFAEPSNSDQKKSANKSKAHEPSLEELVLVNSSPSELPPNWNKSGFCIGVARISADHKNKMNRASVLIGNVAYLFRGDFQSFGPEDIGKPIKVTGVMEEGRLPMFIASTEKKGAVRSGISMPPGTDLEKESRYFFIKDPKWEIISK